MALSDKVKEKSLNQLKAIYNNSSVYKLTSQQEAILSELNQQACNDDVDLSQQSHAVTNLVSTQLRTSKNAITIYTMVKEQMNKETYENTRRHGAQGRFNNKPIHERALRDQLQDHDMTLLMPKSHNHIEVLAPLNRFDQSTSVVQEAIALALTNHEVKHVIIPVGPGHWRGIYLTKPSDDNPNYQMELFDPYGAAGADSIKALSQDLLISCGVKLEQIKIKTSGPTHPQKDSYACGDFTCAYSHLKMKDFGANDKHYNQRFIYQLNASGNQDDGLRKTSQAISQTLSQKNANVDSHELSEKVFKETIRAHDKPTSHYKETISELIKNRDSIFQKAQQAIEKEAKSEALEDEELAAKLQAEEFEKVGFKPR